MSTSSLSLFVSEPELLRCPFCGDTRDHPYRLIQHLLWMHKGSRVTNGFNKLNRWEVKDDPDGRRVWVDCWCGKTLHSEYEWAKHLEGAGGLDAHLLTIAFGG